MRFVTADWTIRATTACIELSSSAAHTRRVRHSAEDNVSLIILDCGAEADDLAEPNDLADITYSAYHVNYVDRSLFKGQLVCQREAPRGRFFARGWSRKVARPDPARHAAAAWSRERGNAASKRQRWRGLGLANGPSEDDRALRVRCGGAGRSAVADRDRNGHVSAVVRDPPVQRDEPRAALRADRSRIAAARAISEVPPVPYFLLLRTGGALL